MDEVLQAADKERGMSGLESPRLQFFLENQLEIRTWQGLAREVWVEVESAFRSLGEELADLGVGEAGFVLAGRVAGRKAPQGVVLHRPEWLAGDQMDPPVGVLVGWDVRPNPGRSWPGTSRPYVGVLTGPTERGQSIKAALTPLVVMRLAQGGPAVANFVVGSEWTVWRRFEKDREWWRDIRAWRRRTARELLDAANTWAPLVDTAVREQ